MPLEQLPAAPLRARRTKLHFWVGFVSFLGKVGVLLHTNLNASSSEAAVSAMAMFVSSESTCNDG